MHQLRIALILTLTAIWVLPVGFILVESVDAHPTLSDANGNGLLDIWDVYDLQDMNLDLTEDYELRANIDAAVTSAWNGGKGFFPVGSDVVGPFTGSLEGNSYTIDQLYINSGSSSVGMFGFASGGVIQNFNMTNTYNRAYLSGVDTIYQGMIAGLLQQGTISNCSIEGDVVLYRDGLGGALTGGAVGGITLGGGLVDIDVNVVMDIQCDTGMIPIGGLVGGIYQSGVIDNCTTEGTMSLDMVTPGGATYIGAGVVGIIYDGAGSGVIQIRDSGSNMKIDINSDNLYASGFVNWINSGIYDTLTIDRCYSIGEIDLNSKSSSVAMGFASIIYAGTISQCFSSGTISNTGAGAGNYAVGFMYQADGGEIKDSYTVSPVTGSPDGSIGVFGVIGSISNTVVDNVYGANELTGGAVIDEGFAFMCGGFETVTNSFWDTQTSGVAVSCAGTGELTNDMKTEATFTGAGWDFTSIWGISASVNDGYPYLRNNPPPSPGPGPPVPIVPTLTTDYVTHITSGSATAVGTLTDEGESNVTTVGFCWNTTGAPTISDSTTSNSGSFDLFTYFMSITPLVSNTGYYLRAYATNLEGTGYGNTVEFETVPEFTDNTIYLNFQPWNLIPPSSPGTITDVSAYGNDASYILADMIDGVTVYASMFLSGGGEFYPSQGDLEIPNKWVVPPQSGMTQQGDSSQLPLWDLFNEAATDIGIETGLLYILATFSITMGLGFLTYLLIGNILIAIILMIVFLTGFLSTGVMPLWVLIFFVAFALGLIYVSRQT